jgi:hypothetical protein
MSSDDLSVFLDIINTNVSSIHQIYAKHQTPIPSLNEPYKPLAFESELVDAANIVAVATTQLLAIVRPPVISVVGAVTGVLGLFYARGTLPC